MNRAVIMSFEGERAIVLAKGGRFVRVPRQSHFQVGDEIELEAEEVATRRPIWYRSRPFAAAASAVAAACLLLFAGSALLAPAPVVAYVTMDVNPSLELGIDGKERVRELHALNADAEPIVAAVGKYKGEDVARVAEQLAAALAAKHLLDGADSEVVLANVPVRKLDGQWEEEVTAKLTHAIAAASAAAPADPSAGAGQQSGQQAAPQTDAPGGQGQDADPAPAQQPAARSTPNVTVITVPKEVREEAKANGLSAGKMAFWLKAESQGRQLPLERLKRHSMKSIASSWGGVDKVLDGEDAGDDGWKQLLAQSQDKIKQHSQNKQDAASKKEKKVKDKSDKKDKQEQQVQSPKETGKPQQSAAPGNKPTGGQATDTKVDPGARGGRTNPNAGWQGAWPKPNGSAADRQSNRASQNNRSSDRNGSSRDKEKGEGNGKSDAGKGKTDRKPDTGKQGGGGKSTGERQGKDSGGNGRDRG